MLSAELGIQKAFNNLWAEVGACADRWEGGLPPAGDSDSPGPGSSCVWRWPESEHPRGQLGRTSPGSPPAEPWVGRHPPRTLGGGCWGEPPVPRVEATCAGDQCPGRHGGRRPCGRGPGRRCSQKIPEPPGWLHRCGPGGSRSRTAQSDSAPKKGKVRPRGCPYNTPPSVSTLCWAFRGGCQGNPIPWHIHHPCRRCSCKALLSKELKPATQGHFGVLEVHTPLPGSSLGPPSRSSFLFHDGASGPLNLSHGLSRHVPLNAPKGRHCSSRGYSLRTWGFLGHPQPHDRIRSCSRPLPVTCLPEVGTAPPTTTG